MLPNCWTTEGGELTATMKLRRNVIAERYGQVADRLYGPMSNHSNNPIPPITSEGNDA